MVKLVRITIDEILKKRKKTKYWLIKNMETSYQSFSKLMNNETTAIEFDTIDRICKLLNCKISDIMEYVKDDENE